MIIFPQFSDIFLLKNNESATSVLHTHTRKKSHRKFITVKVYWVVRSNCNYTSTQRVQKTALHVGSVSRSSTNCIFFLKTNTLITLYNIVTAN